MSRDNRTARRATGGLDENAYLDAEHLFRKTGDLRYLVIAMGKPKSSFFDTPYAVPEWALKACRDYAQKIQRATSLQRRKVKSPSADPVPYDHVKEAYIATMEVLLGGDFDEIGAPVEMTLSEAARRAGVDDPDVVRQFRRFFQSELLPLVWGTDEEAWKRRVEERMIIRSGRRGSK